MEHENNQQKLDFLNKPKIQNYFADLNISLLNGKHIQENEDSYLHSLLVDYEDEFCYFYQTFYGLKIEKDAKEGTSYYYLDFNAESKGKISTLERHKEITQDQTIVGIILLNMYYDRLFDISKVIIWKDIKQQILEGEFQEYYKQIFFNNIGTREASNTEWANVRSKFKSIVNDFEKLGWVKKLNEDRNEIKFEIKESIHRFAKLYNDELIDFEQFTKNVLTNTTFNK